jgi:hypothetical protein
LKILNTEQREQARLSILRYCSSAEEFGLAESLLLQFLRSEGLRALTSAQLRAEIAYLADKGFLCAVTKFISPENRVWRVTATGRDFLAEQKLEEEI